MKRIFVIGKHIMFASVLFAGLALSSCSKDDDTDWSTGEKEISDPVQKPSKTDGAIDFKAPEAEPEPDDEGDDKPPVVNLFKFPYTVMEPADGADVFQASDFIWAKSFPSTLFQDAADAAENGKAYLVVEYTKNKGIDGGSIAWFEEGKAGWGDRLAGLDIYSVKNNLRIENGHFVSYWDAMDIASKLGSASFTFADGDNKEQPATVGAWSINFWSAAGDNEYVKIYLTETEPVEAEAPADAEPDPDEGKNIKAWTFAFEGTWKDQRFDIGKDWTKIEIELTEAAPEGIQFMLVSSQKNSTDTWGNPYTEYMSAPAETPTKLTLDLTEYLEKIKNAIKDNTKDADANAAIDKVTLVKLGIQKTDKPAVAEGETSKATLSIKSLDYVKADNTKGHIIIPESSSSCTIERVTE